MAIREGPHDLSRSGRQIYIHNRNTPFGSKYSCSCQISFSGNRRSKNDDSSTRVIHHSPCRVDETWTTHQKQFLTLLFNRGKVLLVPHVSTCCNYSTEDSTEPDKATESESTERIIKVRDRKPRHSSSSSRGHILLTAASCNSSSCEAPNRSLCSKSTGTAAYNCLYSRSNVSRKTGNNTTIAGYSNLPLCCELNKTDRSSIPSISYYFHFPKQRKKSKRKRQVGHSSSSSSSGPLWDSHHSNTHIDVTSSLNCAWPCSSIASSQSTNPNSSLPLRSSTYMCMFTSGSERRFKGSLEKGCTEGGNCYSANVTAVSCIRVPHRRKRSPERCARIFGSNGNSSGNSSGNNSSSSSSKHAPAAGTKVNNYPLHDYKDDDSCYPDCWCCSSSSCSSDNTSQIARISRLAYCLRRIGDISTRNEGRALLTKTCISSKFSPDRTSSNMRCSRNRLFRSYHFTSSNSDIRCCNNSHVEDPTNNSCCSTRKRKETVGGSNTSDTVSVGVVAGSVSYSSTQASSVISQCSSNAHASAVLDNNGHSVAFPSTSHAAGTRVETPASQCRSTNASSSGGGAPRGRSNTLSNSRGAPSSSSGISSSHSSRRSSSHAPGSGSRAPCSNSSYASSSHLNEAASSNISTVNNSNNGMSSSGKALSCSSDASTSSSSSSIFLRSNRDAFRVSNNAPISSSCSKNDTCREGSSNCHGKNDCYSTNSNFWLKPMVWKNKIYINSSGLAYGCLPPSCWSNCRSVYIHICRVKDYYESSRSTSMINTSGNTELTKCTAFKSARDSSCSGREYSFRFLRWAYTRTSRIHPRWPRYDEEEILSVSRTFHVSRLRSSSSSLFCKVSTRIHCINSNVCTNTRSAITTRGASCSDTINMTPGCVRSSSKRGEGNEGDQTQTQSSGDSGCSRDKLLSWCRGYSWNRRDCCHQWYCVNVRNSSRKRRSSKHCSSRKISSRQSTSRNCSTRGSSSSHSSSKKNNASKTRTTKSVTRMSSKEGHTGRPTRCSSRECNFQSSLDAIESDTEGRSVNIRMSIPLNDSLLCHQDSSYEGNRATSVYVKPSRSGSNDRSSGIISGSLKHTPRSSSSSSTERILTRDTHFSAEKLCEFLSKNLLLRPLSNFLHVRSCLLYILLTLSMFTVESYSFKFFPSVASPFAAETSKQRTPSHFRRRAPAASTHHPRLEQQQSAVINSYLPNGASEPVSHQAGSAIGLAGIVNASLTSTSSLSVTSATPFSTSSMSFVSPYSSSPSSVSPPIPDSPSAYRANAASPEINSSLQRVAPPEPAHSHYATVSPGSAGTHAVSPITSAAGAVTCKEPLDTTGLGGAAFEQVPDEQLLPSFFAFHSPLLPAFPSPSSTFASSVSSTSAFPPSASSPPSSFPSSASAFLLSSSSPDSPALPAASARSSSFFVAPPSKPGAPGAAHFLHPLVSERSRKRERRKPAYTSQQRQQQPPQSSKVFSESRRIHRALPRPDSGYDYSKHKVLPFRTWPPLVDLDTFPTISMYEELVEIPVSSAALQPLPPHEGLTQQQQQQLLQQQQQQQTSTTGLPTQRCPVLEPMPWMLDPESLLDAALPLPNKDRKGEVRIVFETIAMIALDHLHTQLQQVLDKLREPVTDGLKAQISAPLEPHLLGSRKTLFHVHPEQEEEQHLQELQEEREQEIQKQLRRKDKKKLEKVEGGGKKLETQLEQEEENIQEQQQEKQQEQQQEEQQEQQQEEQQEQQQEEQQEQQQEEQQEQQQEKQQEEQHSEREADELLAQQSRAKRLFELLELQVKQQLQQLAEERKKAKHVSSREQHSEHREREQRQEEERLIQKLQQRMKQHLGKSLNEEEEKDDAQTKQQQQQQQETRAEQDEVHQPAQQQQQKRKLLENQTEQQEKHVLQQHRQRQRKEQAMLQQQQQVGRQEKQQEAQRKLKEPQKEEKEKQQIRKQEEFAAQEGTARQTKGQEQRILKQGQDQQVAQQLMMELKERQQQTPPEGKDQQQEAQAQQQAPATDQREAQALQPEQLASAEERKEMQEEQQIAIGIEPEEVQTTEQQPQPPTQIKEQKVLSTTIPHKESPSDQRKEQQEVGKRQLKTDLSKVVKEQQQQQPQQQGKEEAGATVVPQEAVPWAEGTALIEQKQTIEQHIGSSLKKKPFFSSTNTASTVVSFLDHAESAPSGNGLFENTDVAHTDVPLNPDHPQRIAVIHRADILVLKVESTAKSIQETQTAFRFEREDLPDILAHFLLVISSEFSIERNAAFRYWLLQANSSNHNEVRRGPTINYNGRMEKRRWEVANKILKITGLISTNTIDPYIADCEHMRVVRKVADMNTREDLDSITPQYKKQFCSLNMTAWLIYTVHKGLTVLKEFVKGRSLEEAQKLAVPLLTIAADLQGHPDLKDLPPLFSKIAERTYST